MIVAANRDEFLARPALQPTTLLDDPHVVGGKDLRAGGTWLGVNQFGMIAGLLNRRSPDAPNPNARSRGLLCLDALRRHTAREAAEFARAERDADYNPFNLLIASRDEAFVACNRGGSIELVELTPGLHMLTNLDVNDLECPKISRAYQRFAALGADENFKRDPVSRRESLGELLADHSTQLDARNGAGERPNNALCLHVGNYGTCSSSLIFMAEDRARVEHFFAAGSPCTTGYKPASVPRAASASAAHDSR